MTLLELGIAGFLLVTILFLIKSFTCVPQGMEYIIEQFGVHVRTLTPGWYFINPFGHVGRKVNMSEQVIELPAQDFMTADKITVILDAVVFYKIFNASKAAYVVSNLNRAILKIVQSEVHELISARTLDDILANRDNLNTRILEQVNEEVSGEWGIRLTRISVNNISPPEEIVESMTRQMAAERVRRAAILEAEGERKSSILKAEGERQAKIIQADADKTSAFLEAESRERAAQAEAKATLMVSHAISKGDINAVNYFVAQRYTDALQQIGKAKNAKVLFVPLESTGTMGAMEAVSNLSKATEVFNTEKS